MDKDKYIEIIQTQQKIIVEMSSMIGVLNELLSEE